MEQAPPPAQKMGHVLCAIEEFLVLADIHKAGAQRVGLHPGRVEPPHLRFRCGRILGQPVVEAAVRRRQERRGAWPDFAAPAGRLYVRDPKKMTTGTLLYLCMALQW